MNGAGGNGGMSGTTLAKLAFIGMLVFLPACGGGGGGGVDVTPPNTNLNFVFGPPRAGVGPLTVTGSRSSFILAAATDGPWMSGTFDTATLDTTVADNTAVPILWPDTATSNGDPLFGDLEVIVSRPFRWNGASDPAAGEFLITSRNGFFPGTIKAGVTTVGGAGVRVEYDGNNDGIYEPAVSHTWGSFYDLWEDVSKPIHERVSSFVYSTRETVYSLMDMSMQTANIIEDHRAELKNAGSGNALRVGCDALTGAPNQPGYYDIVWNDVNGNGQIDDAGAGQHDTITFTIDHCWIDDPSDPEDLLLDGVIRLAYYEPKVQWGIVFNNLVVTPTLNNVVIPGSSMTVNGGFSLLIPGY